MNLYESIKNNLNESNKMNSIKYSTKGYVEATDWNYKGEPIVNYKEKDFKKGTSILTPFVCNHCGKEFYVKSNVHDFFQQGDFDDPYEIPKEDMYCPKCKKFDFNYNGAVWIKEPGVKETIVESDDKYMEEWRSICEAFCKKIGAKLLFVNTDNFGYSDKDGNLVHMYADELEQYLKNNKFNEMDTWVDPRSEVDGWKVKVLDVFPDDYAGSTVAKVELFDPEGNSQGEDTIYIHRQKVKIGETYDAYVDGIMAMPRIKGVEDFTTDEVPDMKKVSKDMYMDSEESSNDYTVYVTSNIKPGEYSTSVYGTYASEEQANDVVNELHGRGIRASVVKGNSSFVDTNLKTNHNSEVTYNKDIKEYLSKHTNDQGKHWYSSLSDDEFIESDDSGLYVFHDVKSDNREDAASWIHNFRSEAPKLDFKLSQPYPNELWSVDFIGKKQDIEDYLIKLGYYTKDEIDKYKCIEPYDSSLY